MKMIRPKTRAHVIYKTTRMVLDAKHLTITIETLKDIFRKNNFKDEVLPPIRIEPQTFDIDNNTVEDEGWIRRPLGVGGPMAVILRANNYMFRSGTSALQRVLLREAVTEAQDKAQVSSILKGRKWPARRVSEALSACLLTSDKLNEMSYATVCALENIQLIIVDVEGRELTFSPEDVRNWRQDAPIYLISKDSRWIFSHSVEEDAWPHNRVGAWLSKMEVAGWKVNWPVGSGTMEELREILDEAGVTVEGRMKKDELIKKVGRVQGITLFASWSL